MFRWDTGHGCLFWLFGAPAVLIGLVWLISAVEQWIETLSAGQVFAFFFFGPLGILMIGRAIILFNQWWRARKPSVME